MKHIMSTDPVVLDLARRIQANGVNVASALDTLKEEFMEKANALQEAAAKDHEAMWAEVYAALDLDPEPSYQMDTTHLEDCNVLFVVQKPEPEPEPDLQMLITDALRGRGHGVSLADILGD